MERILLLSLALGALMAINGCHDSPTEDVSVLSGEGSGRLSLRMDLGSVGVLARGATMAPSRMVLRFSAPDTKDVFDTIPLSGGAPVVKDYRLAGGRTWNLVATGYDQNDSVLHRGTEMFRVGSDSTTSLQMSLDARYSSMALRFPGWRRI